MEEIMKILHIEKKSQILNTYETFHIYNISKQNIQLNDTFTETYREVFNQLDVFTALHFMGTRALLAAERMPILPMAQHADNIWNEGKFLPLFTDHRRC
jgi:hypothetical protein